MPVIAPSILSADFANLEVNFVIPFLAAVVVEAQNEGVDGQIGESEVPNLAVDLNGLHITNRPIAGTLTGITDLFNIQYFPHTVNTFPICLFPQKNAFVRILTQLIFFYLLFKNLLTFSTFIFILRSVITYGELIC